MNIFLLKYNTDTEHRCLCTINSNKMMKKIIIFLTILGGFNLRPPQSTTAWIVLATTTNHNNNNNGGVGSSCNACKMHEEIRALNLEAIKEQILNKLGLKQAPNMTGRALPKIPPISKLMDMYGMQADQPQMQQQSIEPGLTHHEEIDEYSAKTESVFALAHPHSGQRLRHTHNLDILYFKFSDKIMQHRVTTAKLSLWIWEATDNNSTNNSNNNNSNNNNNNNNNKNNNNSDNNSNNESQKKSNNSNSENGETQSIGEYQNYHYHHYHHHHHHHHNHHHNYHYYHKQTDKENGVITVTLQRVLRDTSEDGSPLLGPPLMTKHLRPPMSSSLTGEREGIWITIELGRMVSEWFRHPRDNLGVALKISCDDDDGQNNDKKNLWRIGTDPMAEYAPYLEIQMQEPDSKRGGRVKRNVGLNCDEASQETRCCRYKLTVDFEKFGWDWIIAPKKYDANYCSGDCPMAFLPAYPNTHIVSLAEPPNNTGPCCAPRKLSEITMLYFDNEYQIVFSRLPGMVVERCGCS